MIHAAQALAFDMDGTLVDSTPMIAAVWTGWAERLGLNANEVVTWAEGRSLRQVIGYFTPFLDPETEIHALHQAIRLHEDALRPVAGAVALLEALRPSEWALVTSAPPDLARRWLAICGLPSSDAVVTAADVLHGKPDPEPYLRAATQLGVMPAAIIAFEDSAKGLASAAAAGIATIGIGGAVGSAGSWPDFRGTSRIDGPGIRLLRTSNAARA